MFDWQGFTKTDVDFVLSYAEVLGKCPTHGRWFRKLTQEDISIESVEQENDTLLINDCALQKMQITVPALVPRKQFIYVVQVPKVIYGGHWEPDDVDLVEVARCHSLAEAFGEFYVQIVQDHLRDVAMAIDYEQTKQLEEV